MPVGPTKNAWEYEFWKKTYYVLSGFNLRRIYTATLRRVGRLLRTGNKTKLKTTRQKISIVHSSVLDSDAHRQYDIKDEITSIVYSPRINLLNTSSLLSGFDFAMLRIKLRHQ